MGKFDNKNKKIEIIYRLPITTLFLIFSFSSPFQKLNFIKDLFHVSKRKKVSSNRREFSGEVEEGRRREIVCRMAKVRINFSKGTSTKQVS